VSGQLHDAAALLRGKSPRHQLWDGKCHERRTGGGDRDLL